MRIIRPFTVIDTSLLSTNITEADFAAYSTATTYALGNRVIFISTNIHNIYESLIASNLNNPVTDTTKWLFIGATNRWKLFDKSLSSQTANLSSMNYSLKITDRTDSIAILNTSAASATVTMVDAVDGTVFNNTYSFISQSGIADWYAYFFEPIIRTKDLLVNNLPPYANATVNVTITDTGNTVLCGALILGLQKNLGNTLYGLSTGITDYSVKMQDAFGNYSILQRDFRKRADVTFTVENSAVSYTQDLLSQFRAIPIVYIGTDDFANSIIYGFYKDFSIAINYLKYSICTMQIEGLT